MIQLKIKIKCNWIELNFNNLNSNLIEYNIIYLKMKCNWIAWNFNHLNSNINLQ